MKVSIVSIAGREGELGEIRAEIGRVAEIGKLEHRPDLTPLDNDEERKEEERTRALDEDPPIYPSAMGAVD